jgi:ribokinase
MSKHAVVSGYATMDYAARSARPLQGAETLSVDAVTDGGWPRAGGAALFASRRVAAAGFRASALTVVGTDVNAALYTEACRAGGICADGIASLASIRTPWCVLVYHDEGSYTCLIDRGGVDAQSLTRAQLATAANADLLCIAAGPARCAAALLDIIPPDLPLAWIAKRDDVSFPQALAARLGRRANVIFCNTSERQLVDRARSHSRTINQSIIETRGADGVLLESPGTVLELRCDAVSVRDATGAGDTLAGEVLAAMLSGETNLESALRRGMEAARDLLLARRLTSRTDLP